MITHFLLVLNVSTYISTSQTAVLGEVYPTLIIDEPQSIQDADRKNKTRQLPRCLIQLSPYYIVPRTAERCLQPGVSSRCNKSLQQATGEEN